MVAKEEVRLQNVSLVTKGYVRLPHGKLFYKKVSYGY